MNISPNLLDPISAANYSIEQSILWDWLKQIKYHADW